LSCIYPRLGPQPILESCLLTGPLVRSQYARVFRFASVVPGLADRHNFASASQIFPILMCYTLARYRQTPVTMLEDIAMN
jgi:hypothetical protein